MKKEKSEYIKYGCGYIPEPRERWRWVIIDHWAFKIAIADFDESDLKIKFIPNGVGRAYDENEVEDFFNLLRIGSKFIAEEDIPTFEEFIRFVRIYLTQCMEHSILLYQKHNRIWEKITVGDDGKRDFDFSKILP